MNTIQNQIPEGSFGIPIIRQNLNFIKDPDAYTEKQFKSYGSIFKTHILGSPTIIVKGEEWLNHILSNENIYFENHFPKSLRLLLGNSLSTQHGEVHQERRQILSRLFRLKNIKTYKERIEKTTDQYIENWLINGRVDLYSELKKYSFDLACEFLLGEKDLSKKEIFRDYEIWSQGMFSVPIKIPNSKFSKAFHARNRIGLFLDDLINKSEALDNSAISLLINEGIDKEEIKDQLLMLIYAGHGTLASSMWMLCYQLSSNQSIVQNISQSYLVEDTESINFDQYIDSIIKECLRIAPPVGGGFRTVIKEHAHGGYLFPKGWLVIFQIRDTELDPSRYKCPASFMPDRFMESEQRNLSFGGGLRECIGRELAMQELKIFSKKMLSRTQWNFEDISNIKILNVPVNHPKGEVYAYIKKR